MSAPAKGGLLKRKKGKAPRSYDAQARAAREKRPGPARKSMAEFAHWDKY